jgi:hypothetical protein
MRISPTRQQDLLREGIRRARETAVSGGHDLGRFAHHSSKLASGDCRRCRAGVSVWLHEDGSPDYSYEGLLEPCPGSRAARRA